MLHFMEVRMTQAASCYCSELSAVSSSPMMPVWGQVGQAAEATLEAEACEASFAEYASINLHTFG